MSDRPSSSPPINAGHVPGGSYIYGIDLIRFICAVSVAAFHLSWQEPNQPWGLPFGWVGVQVFFVISGLVIANSAFGSTGRKFVEGRFLRLYPAAWCALVANVFFLAVTPAGVYVLHGIRVLLTPKAVIGSLILMGQWRVATAYWTLPIEFAFYGIVALLLFARRFNNVQFWAVLLVLWSLPYLGLLGFTNIAWIHAKPFLFGYGVKNLTLLRHGCYFGLGMLIWAWKERLTTWLGLAACGAAVVLAWAEILDRAREIEPHLLNARFAGLGLTPVSLAILAYGAFLSAVIGLVFSVRFNARFPQNERIRSMVRLLGLTTYPFYLLHECVGGFVLDRINRLGAGPGESLIAALLAIGVLAALIAAYAEPKLRKVLKPAGTQPAQRSFAAAPAAASQPAGSNSDAV